MNHILSCREELEHVVPRADEDEEPAEAQAYREACLLALEPKTEEQGGRWADNERRLVGA